jgi:hypothetical protein
MSDDEIRHLIRQLLRVRGIVASDVPGSPAWAATVEWRDELEAQIRSMGMDPDALARSAKLAVRSGSRPAPSRATWTDRYPADAR